jgi:ABC-type Fe3+-hydroxamate transport system substrate-binding protein
MRLVSLCPSLTELLFDLDVGDAVVARTRFCVHPADRVAAVEKVGGTKNPKIDRIVALAPDVVFMNEEENRVEDARALTAAGVRVHASLPRTPEETAQMVRSIAAVVGRPVEGEAIAADIEARAARVRQAASGRGPVRFAYLIWRDPWMTVNADTFVSTLLELPGGVNVFGPRAERYPTITAAEIGAERPDLVLLSSEPFPFKATHAAALAADTGLLPEQFHLVDGELLSWHGSRTPRGIDYAERVIRAQSASSV